MTVFDTSDNKELQLFYARLDDLEKKADGGCVAHSFFMTPSEVYRAERYFSAKGKKNMICFFGGYNAAQRKQIFLLPEYICDMIDAENTELIYGALQEDFEAAICALKIKGSGFRNHTHRDYLGSILALGIERSCLGDICIEDEHSAIVFCTRDVSDFLLMELSSVGNDGVKVSRVDVDINMPSTQKYQPFSDTIASERLDCAVASLFNLSRERAQTLIRSGAVDYNYKCTEKIDMRVSAGDVISARGYGKYIIRDISTQTKKGRIRLLADKYI